MKKQLDLSKEEKLKIFNNFGWDLKLRDTESEEDYPYIESLAIVWDEKEDESVLEEVNDSLNLDECKFEDINVFTNWFGNSCHDAVSTLREDADVAETLLSDHDVWVHIDSPDDIELLKENGLPLETTQFYSSIAEKVPKSSVKEGELCYPFKEDPNYCLKPFRISGVSGKKFLDWLNTQDRFEILRLDADIYEVEKCCDLIEDLKK